jgi:Ca-activated chloride channel homolog
MRLRTVASLGAALGLGLPLALLLAQGPIGTGSETVARPRKTRDSQTAPADAPTAAPKQEQAAPLPATADRVPSVFRKKGDAVGNDDPLFKSEANSVTVDVAIVNPKGQFIPGIPRGNFRILEDGVPQKVDSFAMGEAPMTVAVVVEFSNLWQSYYSQSWQDTLQALYGFMGTLKPDDTVAVVAYDIRPEILSDFSTDRRDAQEALSRLNIAAFSESNLFDALTFTAQRMSEIQERKAILLIASGQDTFSKLNYGETRKIMQRAGVPVYAISIGQALRIMYENYVGAIQRMDWLQADNQMRTFANETGGIAFFPRFAGELPNIMQQLQQALRSQYNFTYHPSNVSKDGTFRKIKVELIAADGTPLKITDKGKEVKYKIIAKPGYTAPREVE